MLASKESVHIPHGGNESVQRKDDELLSAWNEQVNRLASVHFQLQSGLSESRIIKVSWQYY